MTITERFDAQQLDRAAEILRIGGLVAFPTETVYGLGANALNLRSIERIFHVKGRPSNNPLIVHVADRNQLESICSTVSPIAEQLAAAFWPGPLTLVLPKQTSVPDLVTAGFSTVAVRVPSHPVARELLLRANVPVAAPSANRSGKPSGTTWQSVLEDLDGCIDGIVCIEEPTDFGLESTVVDVSSTEPTVLRLGAVTIEQLGALFPSTAWQVAPKFQTANSPGRRHPHYRPKARILVVSSAPDQTNRSALNSRSKAFIGLTPPPGGIPFDLVQICSSVEEYARSLYEFFRAADRKLLKEVWCQPVPMHGIGMALMERIARAAENRSDLDGPIQNVL